MSHSPSAAPLPRRLLAIAAGASVAAILGAAVLFTKKKKNKNKLVPPTPPPAAVVVKQPLPTKEEEEDIMEVKTKVEIPVVDKQRSWNDLVNDDEETALPTTDVNNKANTAIQELTAKMNDLELTGAANNIVEPLRRDSGVESPDAQDEATTISLVDDTIKPRKNRSDSGCSYGTSDEAVAGGKASSSGTSADSGNGSTEADDGMVYSYHFIIQSHLCGILIGSKGSTVKQLRSATKCEVTLVCSNYESSRFDKRGSRYDRKTDLEPQVCIVEGTRTAIDRCLLLIREKLPLDQYPELTLDQINRPSENDVLLKQQPAVSGSEASAVQLIPGQLSDVLVSAIVSGGHVFVQQPNHPTYPAMERLEHCMFNVYERLKNRIPHVPREIIDAGLACVAKVDDRYYRLEVVSYDVPTDCCEVKFLDYGGYDTVYASDLWQIRSDFLTLPFQAVECYLANVIPPNGSEWPFESGVHLEELTRNQSNSCRIIGIAEDFVPVIQLYSTNYGKDANEVTNILVNKELVERGAAIWVEHAVA